MDVVAAQELQHPGGHGGVSAVLVVVEHRNYVVSESGPAKDARQLFRRSQAAVRALQFLEGDAYRRPEMSHEVAHGRPGVDYEVRRIADALGYPVGRNQYGHQPTISKSVSTEVGLTTDWVTGEPSTASRQISRRVSSSASARTKHLAEMRP